ncbi:MAG: hypothetical protein ABH877_04530 [bacterium]
MNARPDPEMYTRYPTRSVVLYDGLTVVHFLLGGSALLFGYPWRIGIPLGAAYVLFAFLEMFLLMPLTVCPSCVYYRIEGSLCISGMNRWSRRIARQREASRFEERASGPFCPNNLYLIALVFPIVAVIPALALRFSLPVLVALLMLVALLLFRFFVVFPRIACVHCRAKSVCPNARSMGLSATT